jgi:hypothetical protein
MARVNVTHDGNSYDVNVVLDRNALERPWVTVTIPFWQVNSRLIQGWKVAVHAVNMLGYSPRKEPVNGTGYGPYIVFAVSRVRWNAPYSWRIQLASRPRRSYQSRRRR